MPDSGLRLGKARFRVPLPHPLVPVSGSSKGPQSQSIPCPRTPAGEPRKFLSLCPPNPRQFRLDPCPRQGQSCCTHGPQMALRDLAQKGLLSPERPLLLLPHPTSLLCNLGICLHPLELQSLPYSQKTGAEERGSPGWRAEQQEPTDTHSSGKQTRTQRQTRMHITQTHRPSPGPKAWEDRFGSGISSFMPCPFSNLATEGVEMLYGPSPADSKRALGQSALVLTVGALGSVWPHPTPGPADSLWHVRVNFQLLIGQPHTNACSPAGHFHSTSEATHLFPWSFAGTGAKSELTKVPLFPFGDRSWD